MAGNKKRRRYRFNLFPLFPRFQGARLKKSSSVQNWMPKNKDVVRDEGEPSCSETQNGKSKKRRSSWRARMGKVKRILICPFRRLRKRCSGFGLSRSKPVLSKLSCGCDRGMLEKTPSDLSDPENFSHDYIRNLLENNDLYNNLSIHRRTEQTL